MASVLFHFNLHKFNSCFNWVGFCTIHGTGKDLHCASETFDRNSIRVLLPFHFHLQNRLQNKAKTRCLETVIIINCYNSTLFHGLVLCAGNMKGHNEINHSIGNSVLKSCFLTEDHTTVCVNLELQIILFGNFSEASYLIKE